MKSIFLIILIAVLSGTCVSVQNGSEQSGGYLSKSWRQVATGMPDVWYRSEDARRVAENLLLTQKDIGGWAKNQHYHRMFSEAEKADFQEEKGEPGATFDNGATITELRFLAKVYAHHKDQRYREAFEKGLSYIFISQYENGGWPQFYPVRADYSSHITFNDDAMINVMVLLRDLYSDHEAFATLQLSDEVKLKARKAFDNGVECILKTQIRIDGQLTVWCAQHDERTFAPAKARNYELPSFSGAESVDITRLLMDVEDPSEAVIAAVGGAIRWFEGHQIKGVRVERSVGPGGSRNKVVIEDPDASALWARFYDLETGQPFFCDRDGIKKASLAELGSERRNGYRWYTDAPARLLEAYPEWKKRVGVE